MAEPGSYRNPMTRLVRGVDGDTFDAELRWEALGPFRTRVAVYPQVSIRVLGVDAWDTDDGAERKAEAGKFATAWLQAALQPWVGIELVTFEPRGASPVASGGFGRWLADVIRSDGQTLTEALLAGKHGTPWGRARWAEEAGPDARTYWDRTRARAQRG